MSGSTPCSRTAGWNLTDGSSVLLEHALPDGTLADYVLCDRQGRPMAVLEAKRASVDPIAAQDQGRHYAEQLGVPFVFLSNGEEVRFLARETDAHARTIAGFYTQDDLERRIAARRVRRDPSTVTIDRKIVDRDYQIECIEALSAEVSRGRRKMLVEMATGTGKTRTAAAFIKRLFEAGVVTRVLFLVDRIALARQAEDAFTDHLRNYPCHVLRPGRGLDRAKRITIATLQTMIAEYRALSPGYFDLVVTDECHRSIYGKWSGVLRHFDGIQLGLTATPCTAEADTPPDPEDGLFVRDTLRFFELVEPTYRYTLHRAIEEGPSRALSHLQGDDGQDRCRGTGSRSGATSSTGARWTGRSGRSSRSCSPPRTPSRWTRAPWSASSPFPSATAPWCGNFATRTRRASWVGTVSGAGPRGARPSCSR